MGIDHREYWWDILIEHLFFFKASEAIKSLNNIEKNELSSSSNFNNIINVLLA